MRHLPALSLCALLGATAPALADGLFGQIDVGPETSTGVVSVQRGAWSIAADATRHSGGENAGASLLYALPSPGGIGLKVGPSVGWSHGDDGAQWKAGAKIAIDRWQTIEGGGIYGLFEANTIDHAWFASVQASHDATGWGVELSKGESDTYSETTLAVRKRLGKGPVYLRAGAKIESDEIFIGIAVNTF